MIDPGTLQIQATAVAIATELTLGKGDRRIIESLANALPHSDKAALLLATLVSTYVDNARCYGPQSLAVAGLHLALRQLHAGEPL